MLWPEEEVRSPAILLEDIGQTHPEVSDIYDLCARQDTEAALDRILDVVDDLVVKGDFAGCDALLRVVDVARLDVPSVLGFLSATLVIAERLPGRPQFYRTAYARIARERPGDVEQLLSHFR
jgi:hypothetical protein